MGVTSVGYNPRSEQRARGRIHGSRGRASVARSGDSHERKAGGDEKYSICVGTSFHGQGYVKLFGSRKGAFGGLGGDLVATKVWQTESASQVTGTVLKMF